MNGRLAAAAAFALVAAPRLAAAQGDAGVDATYGCVESVPKGAQRPSVVEAFPPRGTSGWAATLSVTVRHGKGERVLPNGLDLSSAAEAKKLLAQAELAIPDQDGGASAQIWTEPDDPQRESAVTHLELPLVLLPKQPGRNVLVVPPLPIAVARANGEIVTVCTQPHRIAVEDPIANTPEPMPLGNPDPIPQREEWTALKRALGWGALGLLAGALVAWVVYRRVTRPKPPPPPPPPRPPWEVALEQLDEVRHAGLLEVNRYGEYFDRVSDAVRGYLGARFGFDALESTTDEILVALRRHGGGFVASGAEAPFAGGPAAPRPGVEIEAIARFLRECDLVKFANLTPSPEQCAIAIASGEQIVRGTMPGAPPRPTPAPAPPSGEGGGPP